MNEMKPFRFWVQSVLPVVYDDSLSYLEIVSKLTEYINHLIENDNYFNAELAEFNERLNDISGEIEQDVEDYLDEFVQSEEFVEILSPIITQYLNEVIRQTYDTYSDALDAELNDGDIFYTLGFREVNDGGSGEYIVSDTQPTTVYISYGSKYALVVGDLNVKALGAYGDGVHDDTAYFSACKESTKPLYIPKGTYVVNNSLSFSNRKIIGDNAHIDLTSAVPYENAYFRWADKSNGEISGIRFDGTNSDYLGYCLSCIGNVDCNYEDIKFENCNGYCLRVNDNLRCVFNNIYGKNITGGQGYPGGIVYGMGIVECSFENIRCHRIADHAIYIVHNSEDIVISNCVLYECGYNSLTSGAAIIIYGSSKNITINNCVCDKCKCGITVQRYPDEGSPSNVIISNCIVTNASQDGFTIFGETENNVIGCIVSNCIARDIGQDGFNIRYTTGCSIYNCEIYDSARDCIDIIDSSYLLVSGCRAKPKTSSTAYNTNRGSSLSTNNLILKNCIAVKNVDTAPSFNIRKVNKGIIDGCIVFGNNNIYDYILSDSVGMTFFGPNYNSVSYNGISFGRGVPIGYNANIGDIYINTDTSINVVVYQYTAANTWTPIVNRT